MLPAHNVRELLILTWSSVSRFWESELRKTLISRIMYFHCSSTHLLILETLRIIENAAEKADEKWLVRDLPYTRRIDRLLVLRSFKKSDTALCVSTFPRRSALPLRIISSRGASGAHRLFCSRHGSQRPTISLLQSLCSDKIAFTWWF